VGFTWCGYLLIDSSFTRAGSCLLAENQLDVFGETLYFWEYFGVVVFFEAADLYFDAIPKSQIPACDTGFIRGSTKLQHRLMYEKSVLEVVMRCLVTCFYDFGSDSNS